jgi:hypothetical protein
MTIRYQDEAAFNAGIVFLVKEGLTFAAEHSSLTITLTGGY